MTESKRQSMAGKVATPKVGPTKDVIDGDSLLYKAIGSRIKVTCAPNNNVLEGILFTACNVTNTIAINTTPAPPNPSASLASLPGDFHIIPFAHITNFDVLGLGERAPESGPGFDGAFPGMFKVDLEAAKRREEQTINEMRKKDALRGKGVTKEAQEIFDFITRTLPARWHETTIVINEHVLLQKPYTVDDLRSPNNKIPENIRRTVNSFYERKKPQPGNRVATPIAPRKGG